MILIEATVRIALTPDEVAYDLWQSQLHLFHPPGDGWKLVKKTRYRLTFDANYDEYYVKVSYERDRTT